MIIISPAKKLDFNSLNRDVNYSNPIFFHKTLRLSESLKRLSFSEVKSLMNISENLSKLNFERIKNFSKEQNIENSKQAIFTFSGDTFVGLNVDKFTDEDIDYAQENLRILSGLYGLLRPLDLIQPYRLEMGTKISHIIDESLYDFWNNDITEAINNEFKKQNKSLLYNLSSNEYSKTIDFSKLIEPVITPCFFVEKDGQLKSIGMQSKKCRGAMARMIIKKKISNLEGLKNFNEYNFKYDSIDSKENKIIFVKKNE